MMGERDGAGLAGALPGGENARDWHSKSGPEGSEGTQDNGKLLPDDSRWLGPASQGEVSLSVRPGLEGCWARYDFLRGGREAREGFNR